METINTAVTAGAAQEISQVLQCATFFAMDKADNSKLHAGNRYCKLIKKGENSKLPQSLAIEVPMLTDAAMNDWLANATIRASVLAHIEGLRDSWLKEQASNGNMTVQYADITVDAVAAHVLASARSGGLGQLSEASIAQYFEDNMREMLIVAFADRLGMSDTVSDAEVRKLEQLCNSTRDNLKKLASKKPVAFDERVRRALEWALDTTNTGDTMHTRLVAKLNNQVSEDDMLAVLGF